MTTEPEITREVLGYLPQSPHKLYVVITAFLRPKDLVMNDTQLTALNSALVKIGGRAEKIALGERTIMKHEIRSVIALARVRYTQSGQTWTRVEPVCAEDVHGDADWEVYEISETNTWGIYADIREAQREADNAEYDDFIELAKKIKQTVK